MTIRINPVTGKPWTKEQEDAFSKYYELFFTLKDDFVRDARNGTVTEATVVDWIREHAPEYESISKQLGFDSLEDECVFMRKAANGLRKSPIISKCFARMRRGYVISDEEKAELYDALMDSKNYETSETKIKYNPKNY